jgi:DNA repair protein REV1
LGSDAIGEEGEHLTELGDNVHFLKPKKLFLRGVVCLINGYTNPDRETLTRMILNHGGGVELYETSILTHILAEELSMAKINIYRKQRKPTPVVKPIWIVDCVREAKLLSCGPYLLEGVRDPHTGLLTAMFAKKSNSGIEKDMSSNRVANIRNTSSKTFAPHCSALRSDDKKACLRPSTKPTIIAQSIASNIPMALRTVSTDPNFLEDYFKNSRLSFIGSFKQRIENPRKESPSKRIKCNGENWERVIFHIDMDSFFASVVLRKFPQHQGKPVVICHGTGAGPSNNEMTKSSTSECATCNYEARKYGVKKGMFLGEAKRLCPDIIILPYDFDGYEDVSSSASDIVHSHAERHHGAVEQVSCDEFYCELFFERLEAFEAILENARQVAEEIRSEILEATGCTATVGGAKNKLLAKMATNEAKPDGCLMLHAWKSLLENLNLREMPGVGRRTDKLLRDEGLETVQDIWELGTQKQAESAAASIMGDKNGKKLVGHCYGEDDRGFEPAARKTIGAEVRCPLCGISTFFASFVLNNFFPL